MGKRFTMDELNAIDRQFTHLLYGQGFGLVLIEPAMTKRRKLANELSKAGIEVVLEGKSAEEGYTLIEKLDTPFVALVEMEMKPIDGVKFTQQVRADDTHKASYIILTTESASKERAVAGLKAGANAVLKKPLDISVILAKITEFGFHLHPDEAES